METTPEKGLFKRWKGVRDIVLTVQQAQPTLALTKGH